MSGKPGCLEAGSRGFFYFFVRVCCLVQTQSFGLWIFVRGSKLGYPFKGPLFGLMRVFFISGFEAVLWSSQEHGSAP